MLSFHDFVRVSGAVWVLALEWLFRYVANLIWWVVPDGVLRRCEALVEKASSMAFLDTKRADPRRDYDAVGLIRSYGFAAEEYTVETEDGYLLTLQRIRGRRPLNGRAVAHRGAQAKDANEPALNGESAPSGGAAHPSPRHPVLVMHGFLECSEVWLALEGGLPYMLTDAGFDVWLGNVRGNRYGHKHVSLDPRTREFWKFGMDEMVRHDIPAIVEKMLRITGAETFSYVGFSQGTALAFALFSTNQEIAARVSTFVALAPAARVNGVKLALVDSLMRCDPNIIYLIFGRRNLIGMTLFWRSLLPSKTYATLVDFCTKHLFGWKMRNIREEEKPFLYGHLYSLGSVRTMVHWFQTIASSRFQMYDEHRSQNRAYPSHIPPEYPIRQIWVPTALFYGGSDSLCDVPWLIEQLGDALVYAKCVDEYEHLDFQFSFSAEEKVYPEVIALIRTFCDEPPAGCLHPEESVEKIEQCRAAAADALDQSRHLRRRKKSLVAHRPR